MELNILMDTEGGQKQGKTARSCYRVLMFIAGLMSNILSALHGFANWQQNAAGGLYGVPVCDWQVPVKSDSECRLIDFDGKYCVGYLSGHWRSCFFKNMSVCHYSINVCKC